RELRRANLRSVLDSLSDQSFWRSLHSFLSDKPRQPRVTAGQLHASFVTRMNPPTQLPADFDHLQHMLHKLYAAALPQHTEDTTDGRFFSRPFTLDEVDAVKMHIRTH
ncbi:hypothetical protein LXA43DRAFT_854706, partial [Ganoderma leucocontextum]